MLNIEIHKVKYRVAESWQDITLAQFVSLSVVCKNKMPDKLRSLYENIHEKEQHDKILDEISDKEGLIEFNEFYKEVLEELSDIPGEIIFDRLKFDQVISIYKVYLLRFVLSLHFMPLEKDIPEVNNFNFKGNRYFLPFRKMAKATFGQYIEAAQVEMNAAALSKGDLSYISKQIALLARLKGENKEIFTEEKVYERAELFNGLDMVTVWGIAFFLLKPIGKLKGGSEIYIVNAKVRRAVFESRHSRGSVGI